MRRRIHALRLAFSLPILLTAAVLPAAEPLTPAQYLRFALTKEGDANHGRELFRSEDRLGCTRCHTADGTAGRAGPDLFAVGEKFGRREIIDAVLNPSANIAVGYNSTSVETKSGDEYTGVLKLASPTEIGLMGMDGKLVKIPTAEIEVRRTSEVSLMPEGLQQALSPQEFTDLIEYLVSLKQPDHSELGRHGMPDQIEALAHSVALHPVHGPSFRFEHPVCFEPIPGAPHAFLVAEHDSGKVWRLNCGATQEKTLFFDTGAHDAGARGLIGVLFHPHFTENRKYYLVKQVGKNGAFASIVTEREASVDLRSDSGREGRVILTLDGPTNVNHAGSLLFGADGYLYVAVGDAGPGEDPQGHGQDLSTLLGKILRIDVDHPAAGMAYAVPPDNPFVGQAGARPEIWAYGLREPWRCSFDHVTGDLWVSDVGQDRCEEIDLVRRGENLGWNVFEGFEAFSNHYRRAEGSYVNPVFAYRRRYGPCVTGGYVYRANPSSPFYGVYVFGDFESRRIFGMKQRDRSLEVIRQIGVAPERIASFGEDLSGELYAVGYEGTITKLDFSGAVFP